MQSGYSGALYSLQHKWADIILQKTDGSSLIWGTKVSQFIYNQAGLLLRVYIFGTVKLTASIMALNVMAFGSDH